MDWTEIVGAISLIGGLIGGWRGWVVLRKWGTWAHGYLFGPQGHITLWLISQRQFIEQLGVKLEENDKELDTITMLANEIHNNTTQIHSNTAQALENSIEALRHAKMSDAKLQALLDTAKIVAENEASPERREAVLRGLNAIPRLENGEQ